MPFRQQRFYSLEEVLDKARSFCAYQERAPMEAAEKMRKLGATSQEVAMLLKQLAEEGYVDGERFARVFARSKFRQKQWGRKKIRYQLVQKGITEAEIQAGLAEISEADYTEVIQDLIARKKAELERKGDEQVYEKTMRYMTSRGFEADWVHRHLS